MPDQWDGEAAFVCLETIKLFVCWNECCQMPQVCFFYPFISVHTAWNRKLMQNRCFWQQLRSYQKLKNYFPIIYDLELVLHPNVQMSVDWPGEVVGGDRGVVHVDSHGLPDLPTINRSLHWFPSILMIPSWQISENCNAFSQLTFNKGSQSQILIRPLGQKTTVLLLKNKKF